MLLLDQSNIESMENVRLVLNPPVKKGPAARKEKPWEFRGARASSLVYWDGCYRMYYTVSRGNESKCLAFLTSCDGITWERPDLQTVDFDGSKANNLVDIEGQNPNETCVFIDPQGPPEHRFKLICHYQHEGGMYLMTSPDGLSFKRVPGYLLQMIADNHMSAFYDPRVNKYRIYLRGWDKTRPCAPMPGSRVVSLAETDDLFKPLPVDVNATDRWPLSPKFSMPEHGHSGLRKIHLELPMVMRCDATDPPQAGLYQGAVVQYFSETYVGFPSLYYKYPWPPEGFINDGVLYIQFASSHDGVNWSRELRGSYVRLDLPSGSTTKTIHLLVGMVPHSHYLNQYYVGGNRTHGQGRLPNQPKPKRNHSKSEGSPLFYRLEQRLDGFVSADSEYTGGTLITKPFTLATSCLKLNIDTSASGVAHAALLDEDSTAIPGYGLEDCARIQGNDTEYRVTWKDKKDLSEVAGKKVKLMLKSRGSKLYSIDYESEGAS